MNFKFDKKNNLFRSKIIKKKFKLNIKISSFNYSIKIFKILKEFISLILKKKKKKKNSI
jgi:hypothetical protein